MITDKKKVAVTDDRVNFLHTDEYDVVSNDDILSEKEFFSKKNDAVDAAFHSHRFLPNKQYKEEWKELYNNEELDLQKLQKESTEGVLKTSRFRSICWRCLLGILHHQPKQWLCQLKMYRKHYDEISMEFERNPWNVKDNNPLDNPLSQESDSIWQKYFCDEELKAVVHQDVKRTFPGMDFFRRKEIQEMMVRILFCYAKQNPALCYRQGMHEILAPLIFILHCDQQAFLHAREQIPNLDEDINEILNPEYLEQDAYSIFKYIMNHIECSYRLNSLSTSAGNISPDALKCDPKTCQIEVMSRLDYIKKDLLQPRDPELSEHLQKLDIPLHLFGIRWLRLLFGREFPLQDLLFLWDFIFANNFETVNFIVVAMLIAIRQILLKGDYTDCLSNLMRYPSGVDVTFLINYALHLKDPLKCPCPDTSKSFYNSASTKSKPGCENIKKPKQPIRRLKKGSSGPSRWFSEKSGLVDFRGSGDGDGPVAPGYCPDDPNILKAELEQTKTVLSVARYKLLQFHSILTANLHGNVNSNVEAALDGIFELSCLLSSYSKDVCYEVETACEAGETKEPKVQNIDPKIRQLKSTKLSINSESKSHTLPKIKKAPKSGELKVFKHHIGGEETTGMPMTDPLHLIKNFIKDDCLDTLSKLEPK